MEKNFKIELSNIILLTIKNILFITYKYQKKVS